MKYSLIVCSFSLLLFCASLAGENSVTMEKYSHERDFEIVEKFGVQLSDATYLDVLRCGEKTVGYIHYNIIPQNSQNDTAEGHIISWNIARDIPHSHSAQTMKQLLTHAITALRSLNAQTIKVAPSPDIEKRLLESVDNQDKQPVLIHVNNLYKELNLIPEEPMQEYRLQYATKELSQEGWLQYASKLLFFWKKNN